MISSFRELIVWQKSFDLTVRVYFLTSKLPTSEKRGLTDQMRRCAVSIPSNIAEGQQRNNRKEYRQFLGIARGSAGELETQLLLVEKIYKLDVTTTVAIVHELQKMLLVMRNKLGQTN
ncbi:MAG: four helix bundle protein [Candidatus Saccharimonadales bacterium]